MCVYICAHLHATAHAHACPHTHMHTHAHAHPRTCTRTHIHTHKQTNKQTNKHPLPPTHTPTHRQMQIHTCTSACTLTHSHTHADTNRHVQTSRSRWVVSALVPSMSARTVPWSISVSRPMERVHSPPFLRLALPHHTEPAPLGPWPAGYDAGSAASRVSQSAGAGSQCSYARGPGCGLWALRVDLQRHVFTGAARHAESATLPTYVERPGPEKLSSKVCNKLIILDLLAGPQGAAMRGDRRAALLRFGLFRCQTKPRGSSQLVWLNLRSPAVTTTALALSKCCKACSHCPSLARWPSRAASITAQPVTASLHTL